MSHSRQSSNGRHHHHGHKPPPHSGLFVKVKFSNNLPDLPFDPKFIVNPLSIQRFVEYETTSLEQNAKHELLTPMDLGVDIDLILPERYAIPENPIHDPEDDRLLNDDEPIVTGTKKSPRDKPHSQLHNKVVPWLKKTEYISTEYNRYGSSNEKTETKVGYNVRKSLKGEALFLDKESQIKAINETFEAAEKPIEKHPTKPDVYAEQVLPLFPDFEMWKHLFAHVKFDNEPADQSKADQMSQAIVRGAYDEELQESFVVYFLPTEITMADKLLNQNHGLELSEGKEYEYKSSREYTWVAKQDNSGDDFFFVFRDDAVYYNRLTMEVALKKRRNKSQNATISTLVVKNREMNQEELDGQRDKLKQLEKPRPMEEISAELTAASLEQSYEEQSQESNPRKTTGEIDDASSDDAEDDNASSSSSSQAASSASQSSQSSSEDGSSSSSSEEAESDAGEIDDESQD